MRALRYRSSVLALAILAFGVAPAGSAQPPDLEKASLTLAADRTAYAPGSAAVVVARVTVEDGWHVNANVPTFDYLIPTELVLALPEGWKTAGITYPEAEHQKFTFAEEPLAVYDGTVEIHAELAVPAGAAAGGYPVAATLQYQACDDQQCLPPTEATAKLDLTVGSGGEATGAAASLDTGGGAGAAATGVSRRAALSAGGFAILLGILGGLILNAMPCVLPVLSLKVFGLVQSAGQGRREVVRGSLATAAGILVSFWGLAAAAVAARAAGSAVGWGVQFQRPGFVAFLAVVVVLFCLNLWGLFEITLPWRVARLAGGGPREGVAGHFATGLFATLMATPCSAPFLGTALGFALGQDTGIVIAVFTAIGVGMALPYLLLAAWPGAARLLPKPGPWMDTLKGTMGFFLAAAAVWLLYVLASQVSAERRAAIELALLALGLLVWMRHRTRAGSALRRAAAVGVLAAAVAPLLLAVAGEAGAATGNGGEPARKLIAWVPFDGARAQALAARGTPVFVDVTADWCFTCKVNERWVLETPEVAGAFREHGVVPMKADWTNKDEEIRAFLAAHGRYGIPFYLLYRPGRGPHLFGELITRDELIAEVRAARATAASASLP